MSDGKIDGAGASDLDPFAPIPEMEFVALLPSSPTWQEYAEQYLRAARALVLACCNNQCEVFVDSCPYPIAYLYRHYIELALKALAAEFRELDGKSYWIKGQNHNLDEQRSKVWEGIHKHVPDFPDQQASFDAIQWYIDNDESSFEFRYPIDNKERRLTLSGKKEIRLDDLANKMEQLHSFLSRLLAHVQQIQNRQ